VALLHKARFFTTYMTPSKVVNYIKYSIDAPKKRNRVSYFPPVLQFQPSGLCNSNCQLCPVGIGVKGPEKRGFMDLAVFKNIIDDVKKYVFKIYFGDWGEPFLNPRIFDMISYAESQGISTSASTTLHKFRSREDLKEILDSGISSSLTISIHGASTKTYEQYQPGKDFTSTIEKVKTLVALKHEMGLKNPDIKLTFAITKKNQHEIEDMKKMVETLGVSYKMYSASINARFFMDDPKKVSTLIKEWAQDKDWDATKNAQFIRKKKIEQFYQEIEENDTIDMKHLDSLGLTGRHVCTDPWNTLVVNWDGTVSLCCNDYYKYTLGDTRAESIVTIWNGEKYQQTREFLRNGANAAALPKNQPCPGCILY